MRLHVCLFAEAHPDADGKDFLRSLNSNSLKVVTAYGEPSLAGALPDQKFLIERIGCFVTDRADHVMGAQLGFKR